MAQILWLRSAKEHQRTSKYVGVFWSPRRSAWQARITVAGKRHELGIFQDELSAAKKYNEWAKKFGKPFNVLPEETK